MEMTAARLAATALSLQRLSEHPDRHHWGPELRALPPDPVEAMFLQVIAWAARVAPQPVAEVMTDAGAVLVTQARSMMEAAQVARAIGSGRDGRSLHVLPIMPPFLNRMGFPPQAIEWLCDHYGWTRTGRGGRRGKIPEE